MVSSLLLRGLPLRSLTYRSATASAAAVIAAALSRRPLSGFSDDPSTPAVRQPDLAAPTKSLADRWIKETDYRPWKEKEAEMLRDIQPTMQLAKEILHSDRYMDGAELDKEDEEFVIVKLLAYHPCAEDKIGCGLQAIMWEAFPKCLNDVGKQGMKMKLLLLQSRVHKLFINVGTCDIFLVTYEITKVDRHPRFTKSRCLFVLRTDGNWIDFSYQKCLLSYIRKKYPSYAERFMKEHFKRSMMK